MRVYLTYWEDYYNDSSGGYVTWWNLQGVYSTRLRAQEGLEQFLRSRKLDVNTKIEEKEVIC